ncbi:MAG: hypothetical protein PHH54_00055 [Candidatus Nanoarchaeia archaeon]|nr:hypothetical protein [Candidatus Nanoarchaeia archaeon]MDD5740355.1 hypothetical protein [Candidatus Nanoarchaeia archaeon]
MVIYRHYNEYGKYTGYTERHDWLDVLLSNSSDYHYDDSPSLYHSLEIFLEECKEKRLEKLYDRAMDLEKERNYKEAAKTYLRLDYPNSQIRLDGAARCFLKGGETERAIKIAKKMEYRDSLNFLLKNSLYKGAIEKCFDHKEYFNDGSPYFRKVPDGRAIEEMFDEFIDKKDNLSKRWYLKGKMRKPSIEELAELTKLLAQNTNAQLKKLKKDLYLKKIWYKIAKSVLWKLIDVPETKYSELCRLNQASLKSCDYLLREISKQDKNSLHSLFSKVGKLHEEINGLPDKFACLRIKDKWNTLHPIKYSEELNIKIAKHGILEDK